VTKDEDGDRNAVLTVFIVVISAFSEEPTPKERRIGGALVAPF
jgi:hypothetical protein